MHRILTLASALMVIATIAFGDVEYDNFAPGNFHSQNTGFSISSQYTDASAFTASFTGILTSIDFGVTIQTLNNSPFNVSIASDAGGHPSNSETFLGTISPTAGFNGPGSDHAIVSLTNLSFSLASGTLYWIEIVASGTNDVAVWNLSTVAVSPQMLQSADGGAMWYNPGQTGIGAFRINAIVVPEPGIAGLLGCAGGVLFLIKRSKYRRPGAN
jgi:hypothetical protein